MNIMNKHYCFTWDDSAWRAAERLGDWGRTGTYLDVLMKSLHSDMWDTMEINSDQSQAQHKMHAKSKIQFHILSHNV